MKKRQKINEGLYPGDDLIPAPVDFGRKKIEIDMEQLENLAKLRPSLADCAAFFKCSEDTITQIIKRKFNKTFKVFINEQVVHTKSELLRKALSEAFRETPNTKMLDLCLKNYCGWSDKVENGIHGQVAISHAPIVVFALDDNDDNE